MARDARFGDPKLAEEPIKGSVVVAARDATEGFEQISARNGISRSKLHRGQRDFFALFLSGAW